MLQQQGLPDLVLAKLQLANSKAMPSKIGLEEVPVWLAEWHKVDLSLLSPCYIPFTSSVLSSLLPFPCFSHTAQLSVRLDAMQEAKVGPIHIAMVGKYTGLSDSYLSIIKALEHASIEVQRKVVIDWVEASDLEPVSVCVKKWW